MLTIVLERQTNQSVFRAYVDTDLVKERRSTEFSRIAYDTDMPALIGAIVASGPQQFWRGAIDELRIYDRALCRSEILELFYGGDDPRMLIEVSNVRLCYLAPSNTVSQLQYRSIFTTNEWVNLGSPISGTGQTVCTMDAVDGPRRFYRVAYLPYER